MNHHQTKTFRSAIFNLNGKELFRRDLNTPAGVFIFTPRCGECIVFEKKTYECILLCGDYDNEDLVVDLKEKKWF